MTEPNHFVWRSIEEMEEALEFYMNDADCSNADAQEAWKMTKYANDVALKSSHRQWHFALYSAILTALIVWSLKP